jgi:hypothetical protein
LSLYRMIHDEFFGCRLVFQLMNKEIISIRQCFNFQFQRRLIASKVELNYMNLNFLRIVF